MSEPIYRDSGMMMNPRQTSGWDVSGKVAERVSNLAFNIYRTQTAQDAMRFSSTVDSQFHDAYLRNTSNADGFLSEADSIGSGLLESMSGVLNRKDFKNILEDKKRRYMMAIAENSVSQHVAMTADEQAAFLGDSLTQLGVHASAVVSSDSAVSEFGLEGARGWAEQIAGTLDIRDPRTGRTLIDDRTRSQYTEDVNRRWQRDCIYARIRNTCSTVDDVRALREDFEDGKINLPYISFAEKDGKIVSSVGGSISVAPTDELREVFNQAERDIRKADIYHRTASLWASNTTGERIYGICQSQVDDYYQSMRDSFEGSDQAERVSRKTDFIRRTGTLPTAVWDTIKHAISGDANAVAVASEWLECADSVDPAIAHDLCGGNDALEVAIHRVAGTQSSVFSSDNSLRDRVLERLSVDGAPSVSEAVALSAVDIYPDSPFARMLAEASDSERGVLMADIAAQATKYSTVAGADTQSVLYSLRGYMHGCKPSTYNTVGVNSYMAHPPEEFMLAQDEYGIPSRDHKVVLDRFGRSEFDQLVANGVLPQGAKYIGVYLYEDGNTELGVQKLRELSRSGINYMVGEGDDGGVYEVFSPYYGAMVRYEDELGIKRDFPINDYNPSLAMQEFAKHGGK